MINRIRIACLLGLLMLSACGRNTDIYLEEYEESAFVTEPTDVDTAEEGVTSDTVTEDTEAERICYVYICGAVAYPGVYALPEGSRIYVVNQAEPVTDGMMIRIYTEAEALDGTADVVLPDKEHTDGKVDINAAGMAELMTLPGIGSAKAEAIVTYREEYGAFLSIEDLMNIPGIKEGVFRQIKEHIKVNK